MSATWPFVIPSLVLSRATSLSVSLCRLLFGTIKSQDTLVLAAVLSNREFLQRAGYGQSCLLILNLRVDSSLLPAVKPDKQVPEAKVRDESNSGSDSVTVGSFASQSGTSQPTASCPDTSPSLCNPGHSVKGGSDASSESSGMAKNVFS